MTRWTPGPTGSVLYVVPTLGRRPDYLQQCLASIVAQPRATALVVAPPDSPSVRGVADPLGIEVVPETGRGISAAINQGWRHAGHDHAHWAWLGDDDLLAAGSTQAALQGLASDPAATMVYGRCSYIGADGELLWTAHPTRLAGVLLGWGPNLVPQPGSIARADAVLQAGGLDESLRFAMDEDLFLRLKLLGPLRHVPAVLASFRWHPDSTTVASSQDSLAESRALRRRSWTGARAVGWPVAPLAHAAGRVLHRWQRR